LIALSLLGTPLTLLNPVQIVVVQKPDYIDFYRVPP